MSDHDSMPERPYFEGFTESTKSLEKRMPRMLEHMLEGKKPDDSGRYHLKFVTVLGAGWPSFWNDKLVEAAKDKGLSLEIEMHSFDNNRTQIDAFGRSQPGTVHAIDMGTHDGVSDLLTLVEGADGLFISNIPDKLTNVQNEAFAESFLGEIQDLPSVVILSCGTNREAAGFGQMKDELRGTYQFNVINSSKGGYEVPIQAIGYLQ